MDREKALELLRGGADGVKEWNRQRREREDISDLSRAIIDRKDITAGIQVLAASCFAAILLACLAAVALADAPKATEELTGKVIAVTDGDTINVLVNEETVKVRLEGIDAPESGQSYGKKSKEALAEMVAGKTVTVRKTGTDKYKRTLGIVVVSDADANAKMIENGWAWHYKKYNDEERLAKLEDAARKAKKGLWADEKPLAPWDYRARQRTPEVAPGESKDQRMSYWLNTSSGVRHNQRCEHFQKTKKGRLCGPTEGKPCGICGG